MKIGILTLHRSVNDGAVLQAYCLQEILRSMLPSARVELIDYQSMSLEKKEYRQLLTRRFPFVNGSQWRKRSSLQRFLQQQCVLSSQSCKTDDLDQASKFLRKQNYQAIVVGSDVVWQLGGHGIVPTFPNIFFLPRTPGPKLAFAVSADRSESSFIMQGTRPQQIRAAVKEFDFISVRDQTTESILLELGFSPSTFRFMPDPTILWDFSAIVDVPHDLKGGATRLAGVAVASREIRQKATQRLIKSGYHVLNLLGPAVAGQASLPYDFTLMQRLGVYTMLDLMITDRFHGSIFTLKLGSAPVIYVEDNKRYSDYVSKGRDLFRRLDLEQMVWTYDPEDLADDVLDQYISRGKASIEEVDVKHRLACLRDSASENLAQIRSILSKVE